MPQLDQFTRLGVALAIGLLVGLERGWRIRGVEDHGRAAGLRTFGLTGLLGGVGAILADSLGASLLGLVFLAFSAAFAAFYWLESQTSEKGSLTSVVAGMLTFLLGALAATGDVQLAIAAAVAMTALLALREPLHRWIASISWQEIRAGLVLAVMTFLLLPLLPNRAMDPWGAVNPHEVWLLAILIALISFAGYVAVRLLGERWGIIVTAAAGGLASSTATTLTFARLGRDQPQAANLLSAGILVSGTIMFLRVGAVAVALNRGLLGLLWQPLLAAALVFAVAAAALIYGRAAKSADAAGPRLAIANPLVLGAALKLAGLIVLVMLAAALVQRAYGDLGVLIVAAISGVVDVDAITISMARMNAELPLAAQAILLAVAVNTVSKALIATSVGGAAIGLRVGGVSLAALLAGGAVFLWMTANPLA